MTTDPHALEYPVQVHPDTLTSGAFCYVASHPGLPGCVAFGSTIAGAKAQLAKVREAYIQDLIEAGEELPEPTGAGAQTIEWDLGRRTAPQMQAWTPAHPEKGPASLVPATA